jgi:hypothetical protein
MPKEEWVALLARFKEQTDREHDEVTALGGLHILGTERHDSRRIDNQLRGRAGRQGDPGSSRFYLSLQDDLMRIFGGERMQRLMLRLGMEEDVPIESKLITKRIQKAQEAVEAQNFEARKHLLEYDDVNNKQRQQVYRMRRILIAGQGKEERLLAAVSAGIGDIVDAHSESGVDVPDARAVVRRVATEFDLTVDPSELAGLNRAAVEEKTFEAFLEKYRRAEGHDRWVRELRGHVIQSPNDDLAVVRQRLRWTLNQELPPGRPLGPRETEDLSNRLAQDFGVEVDREAIKGKDPADAKRLIHAMAAAAHSSLKKESDWLAWVQQRLSGSVGEMNVLRGMLRSLIEQRASSEPHSPLGARELEAIGSEIRQVFKISGANASFDCGDAWEVERRAFEEVRAQYGASKRLVDWFDAYERSKKGGTESLRQIAADLDRDFTVSELRRRLDIMVLQHTHFQSRAFVEDVAKAFNLTFSQEEVDQLVERSLPEVKRASEEMLLSGPENSQARRAAQRTIDDLFAGHTSPKEFVDGIARKFNASEQQRVSLIERSPVQVRLAVEQELLSRPELSRAAGEVRQKTDAVFAAHQSRLDLHRFLDEVVRFYKLERAFDLDLSEEDRAELAKMDTRSKVRAEEQKLIDKLERAFNPNSSEEDRAELVRMDPRNVAGAVEQKLLATYNAAKEARAWLSYVRRGVNQGDRFFGAARSAVDSVFDRLCPARGSLDEQQQLGLSRELNAEFGITIGPMSGEVTEIRRTVYRQIMDKYHTAERASERLQSLREAFPDDDKSLVGAAGLALDSIFPEAARVLSQKGELEAHLSRALGVPIDLPVQPGRSLDDTRRAALDLIFGTLNAAKDETAWLSLIREGFDIRHMVLRMARDILGSFIDRRCPAGVQPSEFDIEGLQRDIADEFGIQKRTDVSGDRGAIEEALYKSLVTRYEEKESVFDDPDGMREPECLIMLNVLDNQWKDHLLSMDHLKEGIHLRGYGQKDPLVEYKKEAFQMYEEMRARFEEATVKSLFFLQVVRDQERLSPVLPFPMDDDDAEDEDEEEAQHAAVAAQQKRAAQAAVLDMTKKIQRDKEKELAGLQFVGGDGSAAAKKQVINSDKVGRNDPCPCGSGKKYKKCHGA